MKMKSIAKLLLSSALSCAICLSGCSSGGHTTNTTATSETAISFPQSVSSAQLIELSENNSEYNEIANALLVLSMEMPEVLASTISGFPSIATEFCGTSDPLEIEQQLEGEGGRDLQKTLVGALAVILTDKYTVYNFCQYAGDVQMLGLHLDPELSDKSDPGPSDVSLVWYTEHLDQYPNCLSITALVADPDDHSSSYEMAVFWIHGGMQRFELPQV